MVVTQQIYTKSIYKNLEAYRRLSTTKQNTIESTAEVQDSTILLVNDVSFKVKEVLSAAISHETFV